MTEVSLQQQFKQHKSELQARSESIRQDLGRIADPDFAEQATERENDEVLEGLLAETLGEIQAIERALKRVEQGTYGLCAQCSKTIKHERLHTLPYADHCFNCANKLQAND